MKIKIDKKTFKDSLEIISKALPSTSHLPVLQGIIISVFESNVTLLSSDGTLSIKEQIEVSDKVKIERPGRILVPGRLFREVINKQDGEITLENDNSNIVITSNNFTTKINLLNENDYPIINFDVVGKEIMVDTDVLKKAIKNVSFAAADADKRVILNGVNLKSRDGNLIISATNSYRLAQQTCELNSNSEFDITILSKNLKDFLPQKAKGELKILVGDAKVVTSAGNTIISSKLIDSDYPEVDRLIPNEFKYKVIIESRKIIDLIDKVTVMSEDTKKVVRMIFNENELKLESKKREIGTSEVKTTDLEYSGDEFDITFNGLFLKEAVSKFDGKIKMLFNSNQKPFIIKSTEDDSITQLILPHKSF